MIAFLASTVLAAFIGIFIRAHALAVTQKIVIGWTRLYTAIAPEEEREGRRREILSHVYELTSTLQKDGYSPCEIALMLFESFMLGAADDLVWCFPFIPTRFIDKTDKLVSWSETLRHYRIPAAMVAGVAVLGPINYSFFISPANQPLGVKLMANGIFIPLIILLWKTKRPQDSRIFRTLMGISMITMTGFMVWLTIKNHLYEIVTFQVFMLAIVAILPSVIVVDKSWRNRLFRGRWWLIAVCWALIIAGAFVVSLLITHDAKPILEIWATLAGLAASMFIVYGGLAFAAYLLCLAGIRGSAGGLRLVASGIRRRR